MDNTSLNQEMNNKLRARLDIVRKELQDKGYVDIISLSETMKVSQATIRRDLQTLESLGECIRKHGGAVASQTGTRIEILYDEKKGVNILEKQHIAEIAFGFVRDGDSVLIDSGSTTYELAKMLPQRQHLTVVTNDLYIAIHLSQFDHIQVFILGGRISSGIYSSSGKEAEDFISSCHFDKVFLAADAIRENGDITDVSISGASLKQAMVKAGHQVILLADSTKFSRLGFKTVINISDIDIMVTDSNIAIRSRKMLENKQVNFIIAE